MADLGRAWKTANDLRPIAQGIQKANSPGAEQSTLRTQLNLPKQCRKEEGL